MATKDILIIDDDEGFQFYLSNLFRKEYPSVTVFQAYDGKEACELLEKNTELPDLIFLDINMPVMNGLDFLQARQAQFSAHDTKVIMITSSENEKDKAATQQFKFVEDYLVKPVLENALKKYIEA